MAKPGRLLLLLIICGLPLCLLALYIFSPQLLEWAVKQQLSKPLPGEQGAALQCREVDIDIQRPGWRHLEISSIDLAGCRHPQLKALHSGPVVIGYQPLQLLRQQRLQQLHISGLNGTLQLPTSPQTDNATPAATGRLLAGALTTLLRPLPVDDASLELQQLNIETASHSLQLSGTLQYRQQQLHSNLSLNVAGDATAAVALEFSVQQDGKFQLRLNTAEQPFYQLEGRIQRTAERLSLVAQDRLQLAAAHQALSRIAPLIQDLPANRLANGDIAGELHNTWQLQLDPSRPWTTDYLLSQLRHRLELQLDHLKDTGALTRLRQVSGQLSATLSWDKSTLSADIADTSSFTLELAPDFLPDPAVARRWRLSPTQLQMQMIPQPSSIQLRSQRGSLSAQSNAGQAQVRLSLSRLQWQPTLMSAHFQLQQTRPQLTIGPWQLEGFNSQASGTAALSAKPGDAVPKSGPKSSDLESSEKEAPGVLSFTLDSNSTLNVDKLITVDKQQPQLQLAALQLSMQQPLQLHTPVNALDIALKPLTLRLQATDLIISPGGDSNQQQPTGGNQIATVQAAALDGQLVMEQLQQHNSSGELQLKLQGFNPGPALTTLQQLQLDAAYQLNYPQLQFDYQLASQQPAIRLAGQAQVDFSSGTTSAEGSLSDQSLPAVLKLVSLDDQSPLRALIVKNGQLNGNGQFSYSNTKGWQSSGKLTAANIHADYKQWQLQQGTVHLQAEAHGGNGQTAAAQGQLRLELAKAASAFDLTDIQLITDFDLQQPTNGQAGTGDQRFYIRQAELNAFDGRAELAPLELTGPPFTGRSHLYIQDMELGQILALQPKSKLLGKGIIDGVLPLRLHNSGFYIDDGNLQVREPGGVLKYQPPSGSLPKGSNRGLDMAVKLLDNFLYRQLQVEVNYQPDGTLILDTALKGHNPGWQNGQPIDFNISVEQNLLKLLQAVQFSGTLTEKIDQRLHVQ